MSQFVPLAERIVDALLDDPKLAVYAGDHRVDDRLPDFSPEAVAARTRMLRKAREALAAADPAALDRQERVDQATLSALLERQLFELTEVRAHEWDPLAHNPGPLLYALLARPFAPAEVRLTSLAGRLAAVPDALAAARAVLRDVPRIHIETAVGQFTGTTTLIREGLPALLAEVPALRDTVAPAARAAVQALEEFVGWLRAVTGPGRDPRLGRRLWEARLRHTLDTELSAGQVLTRAETNLDRVGEEIRETAAELVGGPATDETVRRALDQLAAQRANDASIVELARVTLDEATTFVREHDLVSLVDDPCVIQEMPEFARGWRSPPVIPPVRWRPPMCRPSTTFRPRRRTGRRSGSNRSTASTTTT